MNRAGFAKRNARIVELFDAGHRAYEITKLLGFPHRWTVHNVLKVHRPDRERRLGALRAETNWRPTAIRQLAAKGIQQSEIARLLDISRQRVSAVLHR